MPKWSKDATEFTVNVHYDEEKGSQVRIPKPLLEKMGNPDKITFLTEGKDVRIVPQKQSAYRNTIATKKIKESRVRGDKIRT
ncbi:MAG TPA: hypothetical protein VJ792_08230 [Candidatus Nitrosotalea sp.]|nr:hypothetical protein [Candidatus Nitrosotalea sp.]